MMGFVMSGKKVVICPRNPILYSLFLGLNSIISLKHLPRTTLFKLICHVYMVNRFSKHRRGTTRACMEIPGLYEIYRLALSQSNFLRSGLYELVM